MDRRRHLLPVVAAVVSVALTAATFPTYATWVERFHEDPPPAAAPGPAGPGQQLAALLDDGHDHDHTDPATKNAVSRAALDTEETKDPTTAVQAAAAADAVARQRAEKDPQLVPGPSPAPRADVPADRYAMASGCYTLQAPDGRYVRRTTLTSYVATADRASAEPFHLRAADLGTYLLRDRAGRIPTVGLLGAVEGASRPTTKGVWTVEGSKGAFTFGQGRTGLAVKTAGRLGTGKPATFRLRLAKGCLDWPEVETNVSGNPHRGTTPFQEVRGYLDAHTHQMAFEFLGGQVHCGRPWSPLGVEVALTDCLDHQVGGVGALLENLMKSGAPVGTHDPVGWPTFKDWPAPDSLTHEGTYHRWMERAWRGGQRLFVNLLVENNQLCMVYPLKRNSCDDMDSIRLQAKQMRAFERYVDAQNGGPGKGWYRIVTDPFQARKVINEGKLAVVMGIETSVLFGCSSKLDKPTCTAAEIDRQLDEVHDLGVRQMELVNKFDNGLAGVAGDTGGIAPLINAANFLETGSFWDMRKCENGQQGVEDRVQLTAPKVLPEQDALFGAIAKLHLPVKLPLYASGPHCNARGLTSLGDHTIARMAQKKMLFDPDHMSVAARKSALDLTERLGYAGVLSSHSWSTPDAYPRIYRAGGVVAPYAGDSEGFVEKWRQHLAWADPRYYFGFGFGADINGLGAQGDARGADVANPVTYPFKGLGGVTVDKNVSGKRVYDINKDGVAHYGLYPDWIEDLRRIGGQDVADDMARGAEAYLQTWERAEGVSNDACRDPKVRKRDSVVKGVATKGTSVETVLRKAGQPNSRLGTTFGYCTSTAKGTLKRLTVTFSSAGKVTKVT